MPLSVTRCGGAGYKGRIGLYEVMEISGEITELILSDRSVTELRDAARQNGMITLRRSGLQKVRDGVTTLEQAIQHTSL